MTRHPLLRKAQAIQPEVLSIYWNGRQILRIEQGEITLEQPVSPGSGLLTIHFDDQPMPVYGLPIQTAHQRQEVSSP
jgi:hypothetical protein